MSLRRGVMLGLLAILAGLPAACVHGGGGSNDGASLMIAGIALMTNFSAEARTKKGARELWCGSLAVAGHTRQTHAELSDDAAAEKMVPLVFRVGKDAGYALHRVQARNLALDAWRVMGNSEAAASESEICRENEGSAEP